MNNIVTGDGDANDLLTNQPSTSHANDDSKSSELNSWTFNKLQEVLTLCQVPAKTPEDALKRKFEFWETQPVPKLDENPKSNESIEREKTVEEIRKDSYPLPQEFTWDTLDVNNEATVCII